MLKDAHTLTLKSAIAAITAKTISHAELYAALEKRIAEKNKHLNIYLSLDSDAEKKAQRLAGRPLAGVPIAVKDNFLTVGLPTTASTNVLGGYRPQYESTVTGRLTAAGGVILGKTNMDAWAHGSSTETSDYGATKNPLNPEYLPGGSSGGSAAAVAADMTIAAIGTETAGSIRQPASWCGVVGFKPTYGRVPRTGVVAMASSTDSPGPITKTVEDAAILLNIMAGRDPYDATTVDRPVPDYTKALTRGVKGMKIGICYMDHPDIRGTELDRAVAKAGSMFEELGASVETVPLSESPEHGKILTPDYAIGVYTVVQRSEVSSNLARYDGVRYGRGRGAFSHEAKNRIMLGTFTLMKGYAERYYVRAQQVRSLYRKNFEDLFRTYDILISSPTPGYALKAGASSGDPLFGELQDMLVEPSSLVGNTGISIPCHIDPASHLSLGLNIMADQWQEETVLAAAYAYEQATSWNRWATQGRTP